jgi:hypothetical protein
MNIKFRAVEVEVVGVFVEGLKDILSFNEDGFEVLSWTYNLGRRTSLRKTKFLLQVLGVYLSGS